MSGGVFALVIVAVVLVCCGGPIAAGVFFWNRVSDAVSGQASASITSCEVVTGRAQVEYTITNPGPGDRSFVVDIEVVNSSGSRVGSISDFVPTVDSGATAQESAVIVLQESGGTSCRITHIT
jgi:hypothetical protein